MPFGSSRADRLRVLFLGLATSAVAMPACNADEEDKIRAADFETDACVGGPLEGVTPAIPVDYLELRSEVAPPYYSDDAKPRVIESRGSACATAVEKVKCLSVFNNLRLGKAASTKPSALERPYIVFTRGEEAGAITTADALRTFLAPFENAKDATLLVNMFTEHNVQCGGPNLRPSGDGFELYTTTGDTCGKGTHRDDNVVRVARDGQVTVVATELEEQGDPKCQVGRRPEGYVPSPSKRTIGDYLASTAELEAVSVLAFRRLARELHAHGAPQALIERARNAARDEVRHARATRRLAARFRGEVKSRPVEQLPVRPLLAIAEENAREGCVRETFGALVATVQAMRASDVVVRDEMASIARDETEHAALAWDVAEWLEAVMDDDARARTRRARAEAVRELDASLERAFASDILGLPDPAEAQALFARMESALATADASTGATLTT